MASLSLWGFLVPVKGFLGHLFAALGSLLGTFGPLLTALGRSWAALGSLLGCLGTLLALLADLRGGPKIATVTLYVAETKNARLHLNQGARARPNALMEPKTSPGTTFSREFPKIRKMRLARRIVLERFDEQFGAPKTLSETVCAAGIAEKREVAEKLEK